MIPSICHRPAARTVLAWGAVVGAGCASYSERTAHALDAFEGGRFERAMVAYAEDDITDSEFLAGAEAGTVALAAGHWEAARAYFTRAAEAVREIEEEALISPENAGEAVLSWALNESFTEYHGEGYERVMLHACLGLAYLALGEVEGMLVEVRRANALLETEEELYETEYAAGGLGHFLSAVGYELRGDLDDAYIDYRRMEAKGLGGPLVGRALVRLAASLHRADDLQRWEERWGPDVPRPDGAAQVVVIAGVGRGPYKAEERIDVPTGGGLLSWAVPVLRTRSQPVARLRLVARETGGSVGTVEIEDVAGVARRNLEDRLAWLAAKSAVQAFLKNELRDVLYDKHGGAGALVGDIFSFLSQRADLRTWATLPDAWHAARLFLPPGAHTLELCAEGGHSTALGTFELEPGELMFVLARTIDRRLYAHPIGGRPVQARPAEDLEALGAAPTDGSFPGRIP